MRLLTLDIETRPSLAHVWGLFNENIPLVRLAEAGTVISWAAKWHGEKQIHFASDYHDGHDEMLKGIHALVDEADVIIGYNHRAFDMKHLRREWALAEMTPPSGWRDIDLLSIVRAQFKFQSNKLDFVASEFGLGSKVKHDGFELWLGCMAGDKKSWQKMRAYNIGDVKLTEKLYERVLPWIPSHPHQGLFGGPKDGCPRCTSLDAHRRGFLTTSTGRFQRYQCNACGGWFSDTHRAEAVSTRAVS